jgi:hypothetical protein
MEGRGMEKITENWNEIGFEELEERLELMSCQKNWCPAGYPNCSQNFCGKGYNS